MTTPRFGLTDTADNRVIDAVLAAVDSGLLLADGERLADPQGAPNLLLSPVGGVLPGSVTVYYRYALVDRFGFETAASAEVSVTTPEAVAAPGMPVVVTTQGGQLDPGLYYWHLTARVDGEETPIGPAAVATLAGGDASATIYPPASAQSRVTDYQVWRQGPGEAGPTRLGGFTPTEGQFVDDGSIPADACPCDPDKQPPAFNLTNSTSRVVVSLDPADVPAAVNPDLCSGWRLYRSFVSGAYNAASLVAEIRTRDEATGLLETEYIDTGATTLVEGAPLAVSRTLTPLPAPRTGGGGGGSYVANPVLRASDDSIWALSVDPGGRLTTIAGSTWGTAYNRGYGPVLTAPSGGLWLVDVQTDGRLTTTSLTSPDPADVVFARDAGPVLTVGRGERYRLGVDDTGALTLTALTA